jgi:hypothetical protein
MECCERTANAKAGGHWRSETRQAVILHESAMCADDDEEAFQDIKASFLQHEQSLDPSRQTQEIIDKNGGFIPLPMIMNKKTVDPKDDLPKNSWKRPGAAIECFEGASAIVV